MTKLTSKCLRAGNAIESLAFVDVFGVGRKVRVNRQRAKDSALLVDGS